MITTHLTNEIAFYVHSAVLPILSGIQVCRLVVALLKEALQ